MLLFAIRPFQGRHHTDSLRDRAIATPPSLSPAVRDDLQDGGVKGLLISPTSERKDYTSCMSLYETACRFDGLVLLPYPPSHPSDSFTQALGAVQLSPC